MLGPTATVAEALAQIRQPDWVVSIAAQVFVVPAPVQGADRQAASAPPTSSGCCASRRARSCATCVERGSRRRARTPPTRAVAELLASYDMLAVAVCDAADRLLGAVTVDDVLDRQLRRRLAATGG